jgi:AcrR family transcriptional regulator
MMGRPLRLDAQRNRQRILEAAEATFAEKGAAASTEEIALNAGVGIGTVFRHFPTKEDLLRTIIERLATDIIRESEELAASGDPRTAFYDFFVGMVTRAAASKTVVELLAASGIEITVAKPVEALRGVVESLLRAGQTHGAIRTDVGVPEVLALLIGMCQAAMHTNWSPDLQARTLDVVFDGLRP